MNRNEEFWSLLRELDDLPPALEGTAQRAKSRATRTKAAKFCGIPLGALAGAAAAFILAVNAFPTFALACADLPILGKLAAAASFSESLTLAIQNRYVQYIGQSQTVDGVQFSLEYAVADAHQVTLFYSSDQQYNIFCDVRDGKTGEDLPLVFSFHWAESDDELSSMTFSFESGDTAPTDFYLDLEVFPSSDVDAGLTPLHFHVTLDPERIAQAQLLEVDTWFELEGERLFVDYLEIFPTRTILHLGEDETNSAWLTGLKFWFEDETGVRYESYDGTRRANGNGESTLIYYFQSFYFHDLEHLTLCVSKAEWRDKDAQPVVVDLINETASNLPKYVIFRGVSQEELCDNWVHFENSAERLGFSQIFTRTAYTPDGEVYSDFTQGFRFGTDDDPSATQEIIMLENYPYDTITLVPRFTHMTVLEEPIRIEIK